MDVTDEAAVNKGVAAMVDAFGAKEGAAHVLRVVSDQCAHQPVAGSQPRLVHAIARYQAGMEGLLL